MGFWGVKCDNGQSANLLLWECLEGGAWGRVTRLGQFVGTKGG